MRFVGDNLDITDGVQGISDEKVGARHAETSKRYAIRLYGHPRNASVGSERGSSVWRCLADVKAVFLSNFNKSRPGTQTLIASPNAELHSTLENHCEYV